MNGMGGQDFVLKKRCFFFVFVFFAITFPETNSSPLHIDGWLEDEFDPFPFGEKFAYFQRRSAVSFRECIPFSY